MSEQHTPGPWMRSGVRIKLGAEDCLQVGPAGFTVAFLPIGKRPKEQAGAIADARLIAAAPELLAALQSLMADNSELHFADHLALAAKAHAALARATGESA